ncbi:hypothetical protein BGW42_002201 [Actinomortierella wolfii]|nr:hypothetical protein BGW42_002201 [Actinomortierella wolfii]
MSENGGAENRNQHLAASTTTSPGQASPRHISAAAASLARLNSSSSLASSIASAEERLQNELRTDRTAIEAPVTEQAAAVMDAATGTHGAPQKQTSNFDNRSGREASTADHPDPTEERGDLAVNIRFGEGPDLLIHVARTETVAEVKDKVGRPYLASNVGNSIKAARPATVDKYIRLIHGGKVLMEEKTMIESLPKSLFTQYEVPVEPTTRSRLSTSLEAAVSHILTSHPHQQHHQEASRTSQDSLRGTHGSVGASLGAILPTHIIRSETSSIFSTGDDAHANIPSSAKGKGKASDHVAIDIPSDEPVATAMSTTKTSIPVQTGPIYIHCSLSDVPPNQRSLSSNKGKAVVRDRPSSSNTNGSAAPGRTRRLGRRAGTSGWNRIGEGSSTSTPPPNGQRQQQREGGNGDDEDDADNESQENAALLSSAVAPPIATGFDRLRDAGFSEEEIRLIRREFHARRDMENVGENGIEADQGEDAEARARQIEDEWIDQHGSETLPEGLEGSYGEMMWGLFIGFFMGIITLFWFKEATFTRRQQMGMYF